MLQQSQHDLFMDFVFIIEQTSNIKWIVIFGNLSIII